MPLYIGDFADAFLPFLIFAIPIIAIIGGITAGIVKTLSRHRLIELAQRERIAMIERGMDPTKLPPLPVLDQQVETLDPELSARHRSQGLLIGGFVTLAVGISLGIFLYLVAGEPGVWAVGLIPGAVGLALILSGVLVRPKESSPGSISSSFTPPKVG